MVASSGGIEVRYGERKRELGGLVETYLGLGVLGIHWREVKVVSWHFLLDVFCHCRREERGKEGALGGGGGDCAFRKWGVGTRSGVGQD